MDTKNTLKHLTVPKVTQRKDPQPGNKITDKQYTQNAQKENYLIAPKGIQVKDPKYEGGKKEITAQYEETNYGTKH